jgi:hypothetical protein
MELKFHYWATRVELVSSENRWYVTFVMVDSAPIVHEFSSRHDVGDPTFDWRLADQTAMIDHFEGAPSGSRIDTGVWRTSLDVVDGRQICTTATLARAGCTS